MVKFKILLRNIIPAVLFLLISTIILSFFSYFNILNGNIINILQLLISFISIMIGSYKQGISSVKYGYFEGMKVGGCFVLIFILINLLFIRLFNIKNLIYYLLILILSSFGGMIGISRKKNNRN